MNFKGLFLLSFAIGFSMCSQAWEIDKSFQVDSGGKFVFDAERGSIEVTSHRESSVDFSAIIEGLDQDEVRVDYDHNGDNLSIDFPVMSDFQEYVNHLMEVKSI